ncbi:tetratricopeptide repeat protein [Streptomyces sp. NPDC049915]|uniref:tetratricopeptide repeat protein n=1 Tax=Streptomyces sp. NPDC049915 TaxID=3155510 RepID=UPI0034314E9A
MRVEVWADATRCWTSVTRGVRLLAARACFRSAQLGRAVRMLEELVAEGPDDSYARLLLARALERQGRGDEAAVHLRIAAAMTPSYGH